MTTRNVGETLRHIRKIVSRSCNFEVGHISIYCYMIRVIIFHHDRSNCGKSQPILACHNRSPQIPEFTDVTNMRAIYIHSKTGPQVCLSELLHLLFSLRVPWKSHCPHYWWCPLPCLVPSAWGRRPQTPFIHSSHSWVKLPLARLDCERRCVWWCFTNF